MSFLQYFTVFSKKIPIQIFCYLPGVKEGHFLISKPVAAMAEHFFKPIKASPIECYQIMSKTYEIKKLSETRFFLPWSQISMKYHKFQSQSIEYASFLRFKKKMCGK